eukprot:COSAG04_NODE_6326_length_1356_cov_1.700875_1_plen_59_part_10
MAGLLAVGEGGVELENVEQAGRAPVIARDCADGSVVADVGWGAEGAVVRDGEHGEGGAF